MQLTKKQLEANRKAYKSDKEFHDKIINMYRKYYHIPDTSLEVDVKGIGSVKLGERIGHAKRTYLFELEDGTAGDVWHNKGKFIVRVNGEAVSQEQFDVIKDLVVMGFYGEQAKIEPAKED